jgi:hypothetical protein
MKNLIYIFITMQKYKCTFKQAKNFVKIYNEINNANTENKKAGK